MIVWLSGWPQSGSTLCRMLIQDTMGIQTFSVFDEPELGFVFGNEHGKLASRWNLQTYLDCKNDDQLWLIKTHFMPLDDSPVIHYVRDGRNAVSALSRFWKQTVQDAILAESSNFCDWSTHYKAVDPKNRNNTLFLRFEDMVADPDEQAKNIGEFINVPIRKKFENTKEECIKRWPKLFKPRKSDWTQDMTESDLELFWRVHRPVMEELGYV